jgi:hypothetical protein
MYVQTMVELHGYARSIKDLTIIPLFPEILPWIRKEWSEIAAQHVDIFRAVFASLINRPESLPLSFSSCSISIQYFHISGKYS